MQARTGSSRRSSAYGSSSRAQGLVRVLSVWIAFAGCSSPQSRPTHVTPPAIDTSLGPGDLFEVRVFGEQELTGQYRVSGDGTIDYPLLGRIRVAGLEPPDAAAMIRRGLIDHRYLRDPQVSILVREY